jgi:hypothetical protein
VGSTRVAEVSDHAEPEVYPPGTEPPRVVEGEVLDPRRGRRARDVDQPG